MMASLLRRNGIGRAALDRHAHLSSPPHLRPLTSPNRIIVIGGRHDRLSPPESLRSLCKSWGGARYLEVNQGHFGYGAMRCALAEAERYL
jgi:pimeloyl-ACP methyl ester carboxylesterase